MRRIGGALMAAAFLFGNLRVVEAAPTFSQLVHPDAAAIAAAASEFASSLKVFAVINGPMQRQAPALPKPTPPPLPPVPHLHDGEVHGVMPAPGIPGNAPAQLVLPLRLHLPPRPAAAPRSGVLLRPNPLPPPGLQSRLNRLRSTPNPRTVTVGATPAPTGINHWWTYEEGAVTGIGKYMVNVANGNMVVQSDDIDVSERGIDLAFRRTYNSLSQHDYANTDGSTPSMYGDGWTNTFDAHIANNQNGISVFDIDGARYDYTPHVGNPNLWDAPAGQFATLFADISYPGYIFWMKKNGTVYAFSLPQQPTATLGYAGRLAGIFGRNVNNQVILTYYWDGGDSSSPYKLNRISVTHSDGHKLDLWFANYGSYRLLGSVQRPDGKAVTYTYWTNATTLRAAYEIVNNSVQIAQGFSWTSGHLLQTTTSPRWNASGGTNDGGWMSFSYNANSTLQSTAESGVINPSDGSGLIQPGLPSSMLYRVTNFGYGTGTTTLSDTDGHGTIWSYDSIGRVTQTQEYTGSQWLSTYQGWDVNNNLISTLDARSSGPSDTRFETDYAYDNNGNTIETASPLIATSAGTFRPTSSYSYDGFNNVTAYCDPVFNNPARNWTARPAPSDSLCPATSGATRYTWDLSDSGSEPFGRLSDTYTPMNYHAHFSYDPSAQGGVQYGLPTTVAGDGFTEIDGSTQWSPTQSFSYGPYGNLASYSKGNGAWLLGYDSLNRLIQTTDPDGARSYKCYYANGQLSAASTAAQFNLDGVACGAHAAAYTYDADGNESTQTRHFNNENSLTNKWYDAADRLVEVGMPQNPNDYAAHRDYYSFRWLTRYIYDLGQGATQLFNGQTSLIGHGNLIKTQEYVANESQTWNESPPTPPQGAIHWQDTHGNSYDALDRSVLKLAWVAANGQLGAVKQWNSTYDAGGYAGLLTSSCDPLPLPECSNDTYDAANHLASISFTNAPVNTPNRMYGYDPDSRVHSINSTLFGMETYTYDNDGRLTTKVEGSGGGFTNPSTLSYSYYPNGTRSALSVSSTALNQTNLLSYVYRTDGALSQESFNWAAHDSASVNFTYSSAGRSKTRTDSQQGGSPNSYAYAYENEGLASATGRLANLTIPQGAYSQFTYDPEGEKTGYQYQANGAPTPSSLSTSYNTRGEVLSQTFPDSNMNTTSLSANGSMVQTSAPYSETVPSTTFDAYMGVMTQRQTDDGNGNVSGFGINFDAAGRQTGQTQSSVGGGGTLGRTYDAENHIASAAYTGWPIPVPAAKRPFPWTRTFQYQWGANGHPAQIGSTPQGGGATSNDSLHWDGDTLLFTTNASGQVDDVKIGLVADYTPLDTNYTKVTFWDRDPAGSLVACHNTNGAAPVQFPNHFHQTVEPCGSVGPWLSIQDPRAKTIGQGGILWSPGPDGYSDGDTIIQGTRAYDPQLGTWTTPDVYAGNVHDPTSQKPYMWNRNNSASYADPSGFDGYLLVDAQYSDQAETNARTDAATADNIFTANQLREETEAELTRIAPLAVAAAMDIAHSDTGQKVMQTNHDSFLNVVAALINSGLQNKALTTGNGDTKNTFHVTVDGGTLSGHDNKGNSLKITGNESSANIAFNHGSGIRMNWILVYGPNIRASQHGPGVMYQPLQTYFGPGEAFNMQYRGHRYGLELSP